MTAPRELSAETLKQLRQHVDAALAAPILPQPEVAALPTDFCKIWPTAKPILQALTGIVALIPGFGPATAVTLTALITVGDQIQKTTC